MSKFIILFTLFFSHVYLHAQQDEMIAQVGAKKISVQEFNKRYNDVVKSTQNPPTKQDFLEDLIYYYVGIQEAEKRNLRNDPAVQERINQALYAGLLERDLAQQINKITPTDSEMKEFYKTNPEIRYSHILIEFKPNATAEDIATAKKRALEIYEEVKKSKRAFEELVKLYSDDYFSKQSGGDAGWVTRALILPEFYDAIVNMKKGEIKGLIETKFGFHIVKMTDIRSFENTDKRVLRRLVFDNKRQKLTKAYLDNLKKSYSIKVENKLIK